MEKTARSIQPPSFSVLIAAAGSGTRLGKTIPKQYIDIGGKSLLRHTIERFLPLPGLKTLKVIINPAHITLYNQSVKGLDLPPYVPGGNTRMESIYKGLQSFDKAKDEDIILIHDAARPFVDPEDIDALVKAVPKTGAASLAIPVKDSLYNTKNKTYPDRAALYRIQTPQGFHFGLLKEAHEKARESGKTYTDDTSVVAELGATIKIVDGCEKNFKITTPQDLAMARKLMNISASQIIRTGFGYDVHKFHTESSSENTVRLGGIDIPHKHSLKGHSDADVVLHAITDALFGAIGAGDIGRHFPPSEAQWKNADSSGFVQEAVKEIKSHLGNINNLDITIICEAPKIGPFSKQMQERISDLCGLSTAQVNIKATTTEGLGFAGRKEGIAAQAVATVALGQAQDDNQDDDNKASMG